MQNKEKGFVGAEPSQALWLRCSCDMPGLEKPTHNNHHFVVRWWAGAFVCDIWWWPSFGQRRVGGQQSVPGNFACRTCMQEDSHVERRNLPEVFGFHVQRNPEKTTVSGLQRCLRSSLPRDLWSSSITPIPDIPNLEGQLGQREQRDLAGGRRRWALPSPGRVRCNHATERQAGSKTFKKDP